MDMRVKASLGPGQRRRKRPWTQEENSSCWGSRGCCQLSAQSLSTLSLAPTAPVGEPTTCQVPGAGSGCRGMEKCWGLSHGPTFIFPYPEHRLRASSWSRKEWPG